MTQEQQLKCEFIRHYDDRPAVFCDRPATHYLDGNFTQTGTRSVPFCQEHCELLLSERGAR